MERAHATHQGNYEIAVIHWLYIYGTPGNEVSFFELIMIVFFVPSMVYDSSHKFFTASFRRYRFFYIPMFSSCR